MPTDLDTMDSGQLNPSQAPGIHQGSTAGLEAGGGQRSGVGEEQGQDP